MGSKTIAARPHHFLGKGLLAMTALTVAAIVILSQTAPNRKGPSKSITAHGPLSTASAATVPSTTLRAPSSPTTIAWPTPTIGAVPRATTTTGAPTATVHPAAPTPSPNPTPRPQVGLPDPSRSPPATEERQYPETSWRRAPTYKQPDRGGGQGYDVVAYETIAVSCRAEGYVDPNGNGWWYRIASGPWNDAFYTPADSFFNGADTSGNHSAAPIVDSAVPSC
jgi:hypothetical protein